MWISWSPPAPPPTHWYGAATRPGTGEPAIRGSAAPFQRGERETHHPLGSDTASSLDAIKPGRHRRLQQGATAPGGSQTRASQCGASLSTPSIPEIQAKEARCPTATTDPRGGGLNHQDPFIPGVGVGSLKSLGKTGWGGGKGNGRDRRMVGVWVYKDKGGKGLAGAEGALLPSTDRTGRCPCGGSASLLHHHPGIV